MTTSRNKMPISDGWESEQVVSDPADYYRLLLEDIAQAKASIELVVYIFRYDEVGRLLVEGLLDAARRGVKVRVVIDGVGSADNASQISTILSQAGVDIRIYHPLPWSWVNYRWSLSAGGFLEKFYHFFSRMNRRDHRKFCLIDNHIAWCGSFNLCADHLGGDEPWRDYAARLTGSGVADLVDNFNSDWLLRQPPITARSLRLFRGNNSLRLRWLRNRLLLRRLRQANRRVWICSAYFSPTRAVTRAIKAAKKRGVEVKVIVAGHSDIRFFPMLSATYYADLLKLGIDIYIYQQGILHAKALLVDDQCVLGSTNLNHRSFYHDLELDVLLSSGQAIDAISEMLEQDMANSTLATLNDTSPWHRALWFGWMLRVLRYWM